MLMRMKTSAHIKDRKSLKREANVFGNLRNERQQNKTAGGAE